MDSYTLTALAFEDVIADQSDFNSQAHTATEVVAALSKATIKIPPQVSHAWPPPEPFAYEIYAETIVKSQRIPPEKRLDLLLPSFIARELLTLQAGFLYTNHVSTTRIAELAEDWSSNKRCRATFEDAFSNGDRWFVRFADASPKDSPAKMPVFTANQLVHMLATSMRARAEVERKLEEGTDLTVFLRPWDDAMTERVEF